MFKKGNNIVNLDKAKDYPGFEIKASENINIESVVSNPFFHNFNILGISKKFKNFRNNKDLKDIGKPIRIKTEVRADLKENQFIIFVPNKKFAENQRLFNINSVYGPSDLIEPLFVNFGLKDVKINKGDLVGTILIQKVNDNE